jgi:hypothetical protein
MSTTIEVKWKIDAYSADTMPLDRLADYIKELAVLLGTPKHLHLMRIEDGSTVPVLKVDPEHLPGIRKRCEEIRRGIGSVAVMQSYKKINNFLKEDDASATLFEDDGARTAEIIPFPGKSEPPPALHGIRQYGKLDGKLQRIGGAKEWVPMQLRSLDDSLITGCYAKRSLAKDMGSHLFEPIRLFGRAKWDLSADGHWLLDEFYADSFEVLSEEPLVNVIAALRAVKPDWQPNPIDNILNNRAD